MPVGCSLEDTVLHEIDETLRNELDKEEVLRKVRQGSNGGVVREEVLRKERQGSNGGVVREEVLRKERRLFFRVAHIYHIYDVNLCVF